MVKSVNPYKIIVLKTTVCIKKKLIIREVRFKLGGQGYSVRLKNSRLSHFLEWMNPLRPNNDPSQTPPCNIKGLSVSEVLRIENMIIQIKFY